MSDSTQPTTFQQQLQNHRDAIDAIDQELFELILKRADIVSQVGTLKDQNDDTHVKIRPAREARQLKGIYQKFKDSPFPEASAIMIWRHLINGSLMVESPLRIQTLASPQALPDYAREYFGCYADLDYLERPEQLLTKLHNNEIDIAIFPMPAGRAKNPWWFHLIEEGTSLKVILKFPYLPTACVRDGTQALAISKIAQEEPNADSHTALVLKAASTTSPVSLRETVAEALPNVTWHASSKSDDDTILCFITTPYVLTTSDARLQRVAEALIGDASSVHIVGHLADTLGEAHG